MQIGVDVGGTNTDGVIMSDGKVLVSDKKVTTANVGDGVFNVIKSVLDKGKISADKITSVMVGTTHFTNALVERKKLQFFLENWVDKKINSVLKNLIDLKNSKDTKSNIRALSYQLYENNGVVKRENVLDYLNKLNQEERKNLRNIGVKFGRYHIFLFKLL